MRFARGIGGLFPQPAGTLYYLEPITAMQPINLHPKPLKLARGLQLLATVNVVFKPGRGGFCQPAPVQAEAQIPTEWKEKTTAYEVVTVKPDCRMSDGQYVTV